MERTRFSLLLLEPEEIYFEDFSASSFSDNDTEKNFETQRQLGRLKLCSKSLVFDPQDINLPVIKIPIQSCVKIVQGKRPWIQGEDNVIEVVCESHAQMLEGNVIAAYKFKQEKTKFQFLLNYAKVSDCLPQILQLQRASTLPPPEQSSMIAAIVHSRQSRISFNTKWLENIYEEIIIQIQAKKVSPLVVNPGKIVLTNSRIYFQPYNNIESYPVLKIELEKITRIILRRFLLKQVGIEIFFKARIASDNVDHFYFTFNSKEDRDEFYDLILKQGRLYLRSLGQEIMTLKWQNRAISNYEYLLYVNSLADRSFNDLTQYPVFPWILSDYSSKTLDLNDRHCYRDLSKPIGALNEERLQKLKERSEEMPDPKFLYGSHYSTPGFVIFYLVRKFPHYMLCLQNGRFDHPDRMFNSIADVWRNVNTNMSDFKELIPEFYDTSQSGDFLVNTYGINFGYRCDGNKIHDVHLPPWAESPADFVRKQHEALESDYVSENIHNWIDLIFGYKQQGEEAKKANNVFYHLCYEGAVDIDSVKDFSKKHALEVQIMEFGQIPKQIFKVPHPPRLPPFSPLSGSSFLLQPVLDYESGDSCTIDMSNINKTRVADTHTSGITSITIARNNEFFICGCLNSSVRMYSLENEYSTRSFQMNKGVSLCVLLPDDNIIVSATVDDRIVVYDINYGKIIDSVVGHEDKITNLCWGARSRCLVSSSWDCSVKVWRNIFEGDKWHRLKVNSALRFDFDSRVTCCAINGDNELIGCGTEEGEVYVINITTNSYELKRPSAHESYVSAVSFSPVVGKLISCSFDGSFNVFDLLTGMLVYSYKWPLKLLCLAWNGLSLMMGTNAGFIYIWDLMKVKLTPFKCCGKNITCISLSNNGKFLVTGEDYMIVIRS